MLTSQSNLQQSFPKIKFFSLIELLVVIAIIAILASMLLWETICQVIFWKNLKNFDKSATDDPKGLHFQLLFCVLKNLKNFDKSAADNPKRTAFVWLLFAFNKASAGSDAWYMSAWMSQSFTQSLLWYLAISD